MFTTVVMRSRRLGHSQLRFNHFKATHLGKCEANYAQLSPLVSYTRTIEMFPTKPAYTYEDTVVTWGAMGKRVSKLASAVSKLGLQRSDVVSFMASNTPPMLEAHFALPGLGIVLHPINTRLDATTIAYQLKHSESKVVFVDSEFNTVMHEAKAILQSSNSTIPQFINIRDPFYEKDHTIDGSRLIGGTDYEEFIADGDETFPLQPCADEWDAISLNYTSGTTGNPKGVVGTHRGAYLNAVANIMEWNMERFADLLWGKLHRFVLITSFTISLIRIVLLFYCFIDCICLFSCANVPLQWLDVPLVHVPPGRVQPLTPLRARSTDFQSRRKVRHLLPFILV